ncbi:glycosyltransferase family A protein [Halomonas sp. MC140]|nr:glycosyltransferase family A protein [Halomonas sp. MC140]MDN7132931.1 glycosyltransferase family A protein [Halomonas sp. MC140]
MGINELQLFSEYSLKKTTTHSPTISIIIPTYNRHASLEKCLEQLKKCNYNKNHMEVIIIDDCSNDQTFNTLKKYQNDFPNSSICKRKNNSGGASLPRNNGIEIASGEWILFLDSDDYLTDHAITDALHIVENDATVDMVCMPYFRAKNTGRSISRSAFHYPDTVKNLTFFETNLNNSLNAVGKLFKKSLIKKHSILFPEKIRVREDNLFMMKMYSVSTNIAILGNQKEYYFCNEKDEISLSKKGTPPRDATKIYLSAFDFIKNLSINDNQKNDYLALYLNRFTSLIKRGEHSPLRLLSHTKETLLEIKKSQYITLETVSFIDDLFNGKYDIEEKF